MKRLTSHCDQAGNRPVSLVWVSWFIRKRCGTRLAMVAVAALLAFDVYAAESMHHKTVSGIEIYLGVLPAELIRGHPPEHPESRMHGGYAVNESHLSVALYQSGDGGRIRHAGVRVTITGSNAGSVRRKLEPMLMGGQQVYGSYVPLTGAGPYRIRLDIRIPGRDRPIVAHFSWARS